jgi:hypothetical protein
MSLLGNLFSHKPDFPAIDPNSLAAARIAEIEGELDELAHKIRQPLEVIPSEHAAYVFIGKPPKDFGLAWIHDGQVSGLHTLVDEHGLDPQEVDKLMDRLREVYTRNADANRFCAKVHDRDVVVTPSLQLEHAVHEIIDTVMHH